MLTVEYLCSSRRVSVFLEADRPHGSVNRQSSILGNKDSLSVGVTRRERPLAAARICCRKIIVEIKVYFNNPL